jgi:hypothetical protein
MYLSCGSIFGIANKLQNHEVRIAVHHTNIIRTRGGSSTMVAEFSYGLSGVWLEIMTVAFLAVESSIIALLGSGEKSAETIIWYLYNGRTYN